MTCPDDSYLIVAVVQTPPYLTALSDVNEPVVLPAVSKPIWKKRNPKRRHATMSRRQKGNARRAAHRRGRKNPSLVENINAMKH